MAVSKLEQVDPPGTRDVPFGTSSRTVDGSSSSIRGQVAANTAAFIREDAAQTFKETFSNLSDQWRDAIDSLNVASDPAQVHQIQASLAKIHTDSLSALGKVMTDEGQQIVGGLQSIAGEAGQDATRQTVENVSAALDMGVHAGNAAQEDLRRNLEQTMQAAHSFSTQVSEVNRAAVSQFNEEQLATLIGQSNEALVNHLSEKLNPLVDRLSQAAGRKPDVAFQKQLAQTVATELRQAVGAGGPKSLRGVIQAAFSNFGTRIAKEWGLHQVSTGSIVSAVAQAQRQSHEAGSTTVTNVQNNQTTVSQAASQTPDSPVTGSPPPEPSNPPPTEPPANS